MKLPTKRDSSSCISNIVGRGEFQFKEAYVKAFVRVVDGIIAEISFSAEDDREISEAPRILAKLRGKTIAHALEVKAEEMDSIDDRVAMQTRIAILEAFHRALEACLAEE